MQTIYADNDFFIHYDDDTDLISLKTYNYGGSYHDFKPAIFDIPADRLTNYEFYLEMTFDGTAPELTEVGDMNFVRHLFKKHDDAGKIKAGGLRLHVADENKEYDIALVPYEATADKYTPVNNQLLEKFAEVNKAATKVFPRAHDNDLEAN